VDNSDNIWPWPWYFRHYRNVEYSNFDSGFAPAPGSVALVSFGNQGKMEPFLDQYQQPVPYKHMWWFPEFYRELEVDDFIADALRGRYLDTWRGYFIDRTVPNATETPDMLAYFPTEFKVDVPPVPVLRPQRAESSLSHPRTRRPICSPTSQRSFRSTCRPCRSRRAWPT
jgi:hypothetical protein